MSIRGIPFDSKSIQNPDGSRYEDREVFSADVARYFGRLSTDGISLEIGEELTEQLKVEEGLNTGEITINTGFIFIQGRLGEVYEIETIELEAGGTLPRYDSIVIELNLTASERRFIPKYIKGTESSSPQPPALTRNANVWQLRLANILRIASSTSVGTITDTRKNSDDCGISSVKIPVENVTEALENLKANSYLLDVEQTIPSNADLNDYTDFGCWLCQSNSVTVTLENCPITGSGFALRVSRPTGGAYRLQELLQYNGNRYYRYYTGSSWSDWRCNLYTTDFTNLQGVTIKKVWENAAPESSFGGQVIPKSKYGNINILDYDEVGISFLYRASIQQNIGVKWFTTSKVNLWFTFIEAAFYESMENYSRSIDLSSESIKFGECYRKPTTSSTSGTITSSYLIPFQVFVKKGVS